MAELRRPRSLTSQSCIWNHFSRVGNQKKPTCNYCKTQISISGRTTSNLTRHLRLIHPSVQNSRKRVPRSRSPIGFDSEGSNLFSMLASPSSTSLYVSDSTESSQLPSSDPLDISSHNSASQILNQPSISPSRPKDVIKPNLINNSQKIDTQLIKMICAEYHPLSIVEDQEFIKFVRLLRPSYSLPSRKKLSNSLLPSLYNDIKDKIMSILTGVAAVCLTCEGWTDFNNVSFYAIKAHFISSYPQTTLNSALLECFGFNETNTNENIFLWVEELTAKFNINTKICAIIFDNTVNTKAAITYWNPIHISCFAYTLNLVVQEAISQTIKPTVDKVRAIVHFFKQNSHAMTQFTEMQRNMNKPELKIKLDVPSRWNSTFDMLERFFYNKDFIIPSSILLEYKIELDETDWLIVEQSIDMLKIFNEVTKEISAEKHVSLSKTCILTRGIICVVKRCLKKLDILHEIKMLGTTLIESMNYKFGSREENELIGQSIFLDPRFKKQGFGDEAAYQKVYRSIVEKIESLVSAQQVQATHEPIDQDQSTSSIWDEFDASVGKFQSIDPKFSATVEVDNYVAEQLLKRSCDPFAWWDARKRIYPNLYDLMLKRLCIPATSVPCENIFSKTGQLRDQRRSRLTSSKVPKVIFVNYNSHLLE